MDILAKLFSSRPPIRRPDELGEFIGAHAAFVVQKGIYEYSRARAGHYAKVLFGEADFQSAVERSRWRAYPLGLAMVAEVAVGVLEEQTGKLRSELLPKVQVLVLTDFDHWEVPAALGIEEWQTLRAALVEHLARIGLHPAKRAMDVPEPFTKTYFELMPIHKSLRGPDFPTMASYLKVTLCNVHDELTKRLDAAAFSRALQDAENP